MVGYSVVFVHQSEMIMPVKARNIPVCSVGKIQGSTAILGAFYSGALVAYLVILPFSCSILLCGI